MKELENKLLTALEGDARLTAQQLALMLDKEAGDVRGMIERMERDGVIVGYKTLVDWDLAGREYVSAIIELKIAPQREHGFDQIAEKIYHYPEVTAVYLMSGGFDLAVFLEGRTMREVAYFVAEKLAPMDSVMATATHFVLRKYKDRGVIYGPSAMVDMRENMN